MQETIFMCSAEELLVHLSCNFYEVHMKFKSFEIYMNFIWISCELFMSLMSTSLISLGYNILNSLVLWYEVYMNFIPIAHKFIWISLISFPMNFVRSSLEFYTKFTWTSRIFHMHKFVFISYENRRNWRSYELNEIFYVVQSYFMWSYGYMVSYGLHMNEPPGPSYACARCLCPWGLQHWANEV